MKGGKRRKFQNPLRQNYAHVKALEANLEVDRSVLYNFVVFTGSAKPKSDMPEGVAWGLRELGRLIALRRTPVISDKEMENYARKLSVLASNSTAEAQRQHVMQLERKAAQAKVVPLRPPGGDGGAPSCPRCSGAMVKRSNRKTGKSFWGCTDFPKCRGTRK